MINKPNKQRGLSLFETILAVMLVGGIIAVIMNVESGSKSSDNNTILAQDISLLLNKSLKQTESDQNTSLSLNINNDLNIQSTADYLDVSTNFITSLMARGLKKYTLTTFLGNKDSGDVYTVQAYSNSSACNYLYVFIYNGSNYTWLYDKALSEQDPGHGEFQPSQSTPSNIDVTPISPGAAVRFQYHRDNGNNIGKYLYLRSTVGNHIVGYFVHKAEGKTGTTDDKGNDNTPDVDSYVQRGFNFTLHSGSDENAKCGETSSDSEEAGAVKFVIFDPVMRKTTVHTALASTKQAKIVSSKTYGLVHHSALSNLEITAAQPITMTIDGKQVNYLFNQVCSDGPIDPNTNKETPNQACAYTDSDAENIITGYFTVPSY